MSEATTAVTGLPPPDCQKLCGRIGILNALDKAPGVVLRVDEQLMLLDHLEAELRKFITDNIEKWAKVIRAANIKL